MEKAKQPVPTVLTLTAFELSAQHAGVPTWLRVCVYGIFGFTLYVWLTDGLASKPLRKGSRVLVRGATALGQWFSRQPEQLFVGVKHTWFGRLLAVAVILTGVSCILQLTPSLIQTGSVAAQLEHPKRLLALLAFVALLLLLQPCIQLVRAGWQFLRATDA